MKIIKYKNNEVEIDVRFDYEHNTVWLNLEQISYLFNKSKSTISRRLKEKQNYGHSGKKKPEQTLPENGQR